MVWYKKEENLNKKQKKQYGIIDKPIAHMSIKEMEMEKHYLELNSMLPDRVENLRVELEKYNL